MPSPPLTPLTPLPAPAATPAATRASSPLLASLLMEFAAREETEASAGETQLGSRADPWLTPLPAPAATPAATRASSPLLASLLMEGMEPAARETEASAGEAQLGFHADPWWGSLLAPEPLPAAPLQSPRPTRPLLGIPLAPPPPSTAMPVSRTASTHEAALASPFWPPLLELSQAAPGPTSTLPNAMTPVAAALALAASAPAEAEAPGGATTSSTTNSAESNLAFEALINDVLESKLGGVPDAAVVASARAECSAGGAGPTALPSAPPPVPSASQAAEDAKVADAAAAALAAAATAAARKPRVGGSASGVGGRAGGGGNGASSSAYRGVTKHRRTGRFEAHLWDSGAQLYLGGFTDERAAARAYDLMSLCARGAEAQLNFPRGDYGLVEASLACMSKDELVALLRRRSKGFSRGSSRFRGVTKHRNGSFEARQGQFMGKHYIYLGLFPSEVAAAQAYDRSAVSHHGVNAITNFAIGNYTAELAAWRAACGLQDDSPEAATRSLWRSPKGGAGGAKRHKPSLSASHAAKKRKQSAEDFE